MMKKVLAMLLVGSMALGLLAGCGQEEKEPSTEATNSSSEEKKESESEKEEEPAEIPVLTAYFGGSTPDSDTLKKVNDAVNVYLEEKLGVHLEMIIMDFGALTETMTMEMAAGSDFDICHTCTWSVPFADTASKGGFYDITELIQTVTPDLYEAFGDYMWKSATIGGKLYAVPNLTKYVKNGHGITFKLELMDKYGFTPEDMHSNAKVEEFLQLVLENEPGIIPARVYDDVEAYGNVATDDFVVQGTWYGLNQTTDIPFGENRYASEAYMEKFIEKNKKTKEWLEKGYVRSDLASMGDDKADQQGGKYAMLPGQYQTGEGVTKVGDFDYYSVEVMSPGLEHTGVQASMLAVGANSKYPEKALQIIELLNLDPEFKLLVAYGIEGEHYEIDEQGFGAPIEGNAYEGVQASSWAIGNGMIYLVDKESYIKEYPELTTEYCDYAGMIDACDEQNSSVELNKFFGFTFDSTNVSTELIAVNEVVNEYGTYGYLYADDLEAYYEKMVEDMNAAGAQKVIDEYNKQYTEFWDANH